MTDEQPEHPPPDLRRKSLLNPDTVCDICGRPFVWVFSAPNEGHSFQSDNRGGERRARCLTHLYDK